MNKSSSKKTPQIIAHRGASLLAPENTLSAIEKASELGANGVEIDIMLTQDHVPVLSHNNDLAQCTGETALLDETNYNALEKFNAGNYFNLRPAKELIPSLEEALELIREKNLFAIIELKQQNKLEQTIVSKTVPLLLKYLKPEQVIASSFSSKILNALEKKQPSLEKATYLRGNFLNTFRSKFFLKTTHSGTLMPRIDATTKSMCIELAKRGIRTFAWTANNDKEIKHCLDCNVTGIITDDVTKALAILRQYS